MAEEHPEIVGSAITRILVPQNVSGLLSVTTVPADILGYDGSLKDSLSNLIGCTPMDVVDAREYRLALDKVRSDDFWDKVRHAVDFYGPFGFEVWHEHRRIFKDSIGELVDSDLAKHSLTAELAPGSFGSAPPFLGGLYGLPFGTAERGRLREVFDSELSIDTFSSSMKILSEFLSASDRATAALRGMYSYDIPFGHSPVTTAQQLESIVKSAKAIAVAPLVAGTAGVSNAIAAGHYVVALDCALTGGATTLIFIGTIALAELLTRKLAEQRAQKKNKVAVVPPPSPPRAAAA